MTGKGNEIEKTNCSFAPRSEMCTQRRAYIMPIITLVIPCRRFLFFFPSLFLLFPCLRCWIPVFPCKRTILVSVGRTGSSRGYRKMLRRDFRCDRSKEGMARWNLSVEENGPGGGRFAVRWPVRSIVSFDRSCAQGCGRVVVLVQQPRGFRHVLRSPIP